MLQHGTTSRFSDGVGLTFIPAPEKKNGMAEFNIRPATVDDIPILIRHRRLMWWDMGRRDETALEWMDAAAHEYFLTAVSDGSYRGFLAADQNGEVVGG